MKKLLKTYVFLFSLGLVLSFSGTGAVAQCAMCRSNVESNIQSDASKVGSGLNSGIVYLMAIPYLLAATVGFFWYKYNRRA
jgi:hypothetical protein